MRNIGGEVWLRHPLRGKVFGSNPADSKNPTMLRVGVVQARCDPQVILMAWMPLVCGNLPNGKPTSHGGSSHYPKKNHSIVFVSLLLTRINKTKNLEPTLKTNSIMILRDEREKQLILLVDVKNE